MYVVVSNTQLTFFYTSKLKYNYLDHYISIFLYFEVTNYMCCVVMKSAHGSNFIKKKLINLSSSKLIMIEMQWQF